MNDFFSQLDSFITLISLYINPLHKHKTPSHQSMASASSTSSQRGVAMVLALVSAVVLSPLYVTRKGDHFYHERKVVMSGSNFVVPLVLGGLIIAIKTTSSSKMKMVKSKGYNEASGGLRIGSSMGLAGVLVLLLIVVSWQDSLQDFFWRWWSNCLYGIRKNAMGIMYLNNVSGRV